MENNSYLVSKHFVTSVACENVKFGHCHDFFELVTNYVMTCHDLSKIPTILINRECKSGSYLKFGIFRKTRVQ